MFLAKIVFAVFACTLVTRYVFVSSQDTEDNTKEKEDKENKDKEEEKPERPLENHSFVALIDILFVDGTKRRCTGTIIHDNAIITAAHCFLNHGDQYTDVELSGSFIVAGTKKMFDTGYENYLPIERVVTHPKYKGWTADLALVFTFAGLTTDKTGQVIPIIEESESTPVDSNVTILSWGNYCDEEAPLTATKYPGDKKRQCSSSEEGDESCESAKRKPLRGADSRQLDSSEVHIGPSLQTTISQHRAFQAKVKPESLTKVLPTLTTSNSDEVPTTMNVQTLSREHDRDVTKENKDTNGSDEPIKPHGSYPSNGPTQSKKTPGNIRMKEPALSIGSPYLMPVPGKLKKKDDITPQKTSKQRYGKTYRNMSFGSKQEEDPPEKEQDWSKMLETVIQRSGLNRSHEEENTTPLFKESRRKRNKSPPAKENKLTVETFGFVNVQTCKKLIDKALPKLYRINTNEVVCYAAEDHFISDDDSGAPAVREGHLVAVTVGGAECEGDHVAIGMKMTCYCSWILENLPPGENKMKCCTDCCGEENNKNHNKKNHYKKEDPKDATYLRTSNHKHKYKSRKKPEE